MESGFSSNNLELLALDNVINKLQLYMSKKNQTLHGLASTMGFAYQPFYRLVTKKHMPTISSLALIASHLNCNIAELTSECIFIDIDCYHFFADKKDNNVINKCRVYIPYQQYAPWVHSDFFAIKDIKINKGINNQYNLFFSVEKITIDGLFWVEYKEKQTLINVLSISTKFVIIEEQQKEIKVDIDLIKPIAKFFGGVELFEKECTQKLLGVLL